MCAHHIACAERAIQPDRVRLRVRHADPERLVRLAAQRAPRVVDDRAGHEDRPPLALGLEELLECVERGLGVERVEDGLNEEDVNAAGPEALRLRARLTV